MYLYKPHIALATAVALSVSIFFFDGLFKDSLPVSLQVSNVAIPAGLTTPFWIYFIFIQVVLLVVLYRKFAQHQCHCPLCTPAFSPAYSVIKVLGEGSFAKVLLVSSKKRELFAIKQARIDDITEANEDAFVEMQLLLQVEHKGLVKVEDSFFHLEREWGRWGVRKQLYYCLVEEYCAGGDLFDLVERQHKECGGFEEGACLELFVKIVEGLDFMHGKNIIHRDLKLENILVSRKGELKIADLGLGEKLRSKVVSGSYAGTEGYTAPEIWLGRKYSKACDIWSLGILLFTMQCWVDVFSVLKDAHLARDTDTDCIQIILRDPATTISIVLQKVEPFPVIRSLLQKMLCVRPQDRISSSQLLQLEVLRPYRRPRKRRTSTSCSPQKTLNS